MILHVHAHAHACMYELLLTLSYQSKVLLNFHNYKNRYILTITEYFSLLNPYNACFWLISQKFSKTIKKKSYKWEIFKNSLFCRNFTRRARFNIFLTILDQKTKIEFFEILAIFGELLFLGAIFHPEGVKLTTSRDNTYER